LKIEPAVACRDFSSFDFYPALPGMLGAPLIRHQVVQVCQACEKRLLASSWVVKPFHHEEFSVNGIMDLIQEGAGHGHLRVCEHCIPARLLVLKPASYALAVGRPSRVGDVVGKVA
jgi:hypothetical protein